MLCPDAVQKHFSQLEVVLQSPIIPLDLQNLSAALINANQLLSRSDNCCIVVAISTSSKKVHKIKNLYRSITILKRLQLQLQLQLNKDNQKLQCRLIGVYPSLEYPACVYELGTTADRYVSSKVLPFTGSYLIDIVKQLISILLGVNPAVGGVGLILYKD